MCDPGGDQAGGSALLAARTRVLQASSVSSRRAAMLLDAGFPISQFPCLNKLWDHESGWNYKATNRSSGAYGIPQALPGSKMAKAGSDWRTNPATQIIWAVGYMKDRYGSPCAAWSFKRSHGWY